ncbi:putative necrosis-inducing factor-domain-containing protein [Cadophora sp. MPI-SDFR-AT-0126]|nr:putative necrosis-inducing factor-domain-containing protein [Leotiomycetes sp. MPI-SDFR-AT-0126]
MVSSKTLHLALLTLLPLSLAVPTPNPAIESVPSSTEPVDWIPIEGTTVFVNSAALVDTTIDPAKKVKRLLQARSGADRCGASSFSGIPAPWANTGDCWAIHDYCRDRNTYWGVWDHTSSTHPVLTAGTCVFEAGTKNIFQTYIGSYDIRDLIRDGINKFQGNGQVGAQGDMGCENTGELSGSRVNWKVKHS